MRLCQITVLHAWYNINKENYGWFKHIWNFKLAEYVNVFEDRTLFNLPQHNEVTSTRVPTCLLIVR